METPTDKNQEIIVNLKFTGNAFLALSALMRQTGRRAEDLTLEGIALRLIQSEAYGGGLQLATIKVNTDETYTIVEFLPENDIEGGGDTPPPPEPDGAAILPFRTRT